MRLATVAWGPWLAPRERVPRKYPRAGFVVDANPTAPDMWAARVLAGELISGELRSQRLARGTEGEHQRPLRRAIAER